jgi:hypothetical protein
VVERNQREVATRSPKELEKENEHVYRRAEPVTWIAA